MTNQCGTCTLCCKVMGVEEINKPRGVWCMHCLKKRGCGIYPDRPESCREFTCLWLMMDLDEVYKPEYSKVVLITDKTGTHLVAEVDPGYPNAWRQQPMYGLIMRMSHESTTFVRIGLRTIVIKDGEVVDDAVIPIDPTNPSTARITIDA